MGFLSLVFVLFHGLPIFILLAPLFVAARPWPSLWHCHHTSPPPQPQTSKQEDLPDDVLSFGSTGPEVARLQRCLIALGHMPASAVRYHIGFFGPRTHQA